MRSKNKKGLMGIRLILILAVIVLFVAWAFHKGYFKWKGPSAEKVAQEAKEDVSDSIKDLKK